MGKDEEVAPGPHGATAEARSNTMCNGHVKMVTLSGLVNRVGLHWYLLFCQQYTKLQQALQNSH